MKNALQAIPDERKGKIANSIMTKRQSDIILQPDAGLFNELSLLIEQSQTRLQSYANSTLTTLFWQVGKRINENILQYKRADYGK